MEFEKLQQIIADVLKLIQSEDRAGQQERLRHIVEQPARHVVDLDHLVSHHRDAAHDKQHRAGILRDFKAFLVFHGFLLFYLFTFTPSCRRQLPATG